jgi:diguanylate cyclase (GGDEF)-like protein
MRRHRTKILDGSAILAVLAVALFVAFQIDIFVTEGQVSAREQMIELDEVLLLGGLLCCGLLLFALRRNREQKQETLRRQAAERQARELAMQDGLTGLPNRRQYDDALRAAIGAPPGDGAVHAVFLLDLNGFKQINDSYGHGVGDEVLIIVAQRLLGVMRGGDLVARFGGDEFAILARHLVSAEAASSVALRVIEALERPITTGVLRHPVGVGIGIALIPTDANNPAEALRKADVALYRAKAERRSAFRFFKEHMDEQLRERHRLEAELRRALQQSAIDVVYTPSIDLRTRAVVGFEASPRWVHLELGEIAPNRFIPIAEESGLTHELAAYVLRQACAAAAHWPAHVTVAVDLMPGQLRDHELSKHIADILREGALTPSRLEVEITESALVRDLEAAQEVLGALRESGVRIVLDNFGTGYSSLYHLRNCRPDKIKIDRTFVDGMLSQHDSAAVVRALIGLGQGLGFTIAAEGIEDSQQQTSLLSTGCEVGQGDLYSRDLPAEQTALLFTPRLVGA